MGQMYTGTRKEVKQVAQTKSKHGIQGEGEGSGGAGDIKHHMHVVGIVMNFKHIHLILPQEILEIFGLKN